MLLNYLVIQLAMNYWTDGIVYDLHADGKKANKIEVIAGKSFIVMPLETIEELNKEGLPVKPGDLGEHITIQGIPYNQLVIGSIWKINDIKVVLQNNRWWSDVLREDVTVERLKHLPYVKNWEKFSNAIKNKMGWLVYIQKGIIKKGDRIENLGPVQ